MPIYSKDALRCLFIHIPKTGGTSVEHLMRKRRWQESLIFHGRFGSHHHLRVTPQHYHAALLDELVRWDEFQLVFTLCRHPFDRLKSEYYWQHQVGIAPARLPGEWFDVLQQRYLKDKCAFDNHVRPQSDFIPSAWPCEIFRLEDNGVRQAVERAERLAPAGWLARALQLTTSSRRQSTSPSRQVEEAFLALRPHIEQFYAADMTRFGY
jgi:hypothetical protein